jgi:hypothetical protein
MPEIHFSYEESQVSPSPPFPDGAIRRRPKTQAMLTSSAGVEFEAEVLLDSGADSCCFPLAFAKALGIDYETLPKDVSVGVGGSIDTYWDTVKIDLGHGIFFDAKVGFMQSMNEYAVGLLGQNGFFSKFDVTFCHRKNVFIITVPSLLTRIIRRTRSILFRRKIVS